MYYFSSDFKSQHNFTKFKYNKVVFFTKIFYIKLLLRTILINLAIKTYVKIIFDRHFNIAMYYLVATDGQSLHPFTTFYIQKRVL